MGRRLERRCSGRVQYVEARAIGAVNSAARVRREEERERGRTVVHLVDVLVEARRVEEPVDVEKTRLFGQEAEGEGSERLPDAGKRGNGREGEVESHCDREGKVDQKLRSFTVSWAILSVSYRRT